MKASTTKTLFGQETTVQIEIASTPEKIWDLLTDAKKYSHWNSTIVSIQGKIALGETIKLTSTLDESRTFSLKVKVFDIAKKLVWGDGKGERTYHLIQQENERVLVEMTEQIGGWMFPMYSRFLPSFDTSFDQFVTDLKKPLK